ncbi:nitroreductase family deazaflavin-dependent oxidoreductase [Nocardioides salarius]|uniref:Deazaflavin-dependent oxidoreductase (Nitroreductase family) n=1 Tax=Nocardioides salarius TaxID=374513 RepID=A0ABS2M8X3_9ACTN|nr:nitroreductase family deazaflavin-dependent oxidoreductase [Nocardioides salarius]MBM7507616.1 deazaflavin-dependent oxidoreductase (nitroreductase family) [Nocardioides salarius]
MTSAIDLHGAPHVARYLETNGEDGYHWRNGTTVLILFTTGRRSGEPRTNALIFRPWGDAYLVIASKGGADSPPAWFLNLSDDPEVEVQVKDRRIPVRARVATPDEKPEMWRTMVEAWPDYDDYQASTDREIPVVVLEPR